MRVRQGTVPLPIESIGRVQVPDELSAARVQLEELRQQQEELERQREMLEALRMRQDRLLGGRREVMRRMDEHLALMAEDIEACHLRIEILVQAHEDFQFHLKALRAQQPETWQRDELAQRLDEALEDLQRAEECFESTSRRMERRTSPALLPGAQVLPGEQWAGWVLKGLCFHSPLLALAALLYWLIR